jgi:hypothetical protein
VHSSPADALLIFKMAATSFMVSTSSSPIPSSEVSSGW